MISNIISNGLYNNQFCRFRKEKKIITDDADLELSVKDKNKKPEPEDIKVSFWYNLSLCRMTSQISKLLVMISNHTNKFDHSFLTENSQVNLNDISSELKNTSSKLEIGNFQHSRIMGSKGSKIGSEKSASEEPPQSNLKVDSKMHNIAL